jgi:GAF domain-containing protein
VTCGILVEGKLWGALTAGARGEQPLPEDAEARIAAFTELVATAVSNAQAREDLQRLADEQAALRRIAVLVAQQPSQKEVFTAVAEAVGSVLGADVTGMVMCSDDLTGTLVAGWGRGAAPVPVGMRLPLDKDGVTARVFHSAAPARIDETAQGASSELAGTLGVSSSVGAPILMGGKLWGVLGASVCGDDPLPEDAEARIAAFTELVATAVSNAQAREDLQRLADAQAALRRVATLVARGIGPDAVFRAVASEVGVIFGADVAAIVRFEDDGTATVLGDVGGPHVAGQARRARRGLRRPPRSRDRSSGAVRHG